MPDQDGKPKKPHRRPPGTPKRTPEQLAMIARINGSKGGRPLGSKNVLPLGAVSALKTAKFRVRRDIDASIRDEAAEIAGYALERTVSVLAGNINSRKAPSILKAATQLREEICEPVVKESRITGSMTLEQLVAQASEKAPK